MVRREHVFVDKLKPFHVQTIPDYSFNMLLAKSEEILGFDDGPGYVANLDQSCLEFAALNPGFDLAAMDV